MNDSIGSLIGLRLRQLRFRTNISQIEWARRVGKSKQAASAWETGRADLTATNLLKIAAVLRCDLQYFLTGKQFAESPLTTWLRRNLCFVVRKR